MRGRLQAVSLAFVAVSAIGCSGSSTPAPTALVPSTSTPSSPADTHAVAGPVGLAVAGTQVWVAASGDGSVVGFDSVAGRQLRSVHVGSTPLRVVFDGRRLWVSVFGDGAVVAVDPASGSVVRRVSMPGQPEGMAWAHGRLWVVRQQSRLLTEVDATGHVGRSVRLASEPRLAVSSKDAVFVSEFGNGTVTRVDTASGRVTRSPHVCEGPQGLALSGSTLWVTCTTSDVVVTIDTATMRRLGQVSVAGEPDGITVQGSRISVVATDGPALVELGGPAASPRVLQRSRLAQAVPLNDRANDDVVLVRGSIWVSSFGEDVVRVVRP